MPIKLKPRNCRLPQCGVTFTPKRGQDWKSDFCSSEHRREFWRLARHAGSVFVENGALPLESVELVRPSRLTHADQVLDLLEQAGGWLEHPRQKLPHVIWNSTIAKLRTRGYVIQSRLVTSEGKRDYQYHLVRSGATSHAPTPQEGQ